MAAAKILPAIADDMATFHKLTYHPYPELVAPQHIVIKSGLFSLGRARDSDPGSLVGSWIHGPTAWHPREHGAAVPNARATVDSEGGLEQITLLFSDIAQSPVPLPMVLELLGITETDARAAGPGLKATMAQMESAVTKSIEDDDTVENYTKVFKQHIARLENAEKVMGEVSAPLQALHKSCGGDLAKIEAFFCDLAPAPHTGKPMPPGMINALIRVPTEAKTCSEEEFLGCVRRNLDPTDSSDHLLPTIKKHTV